MLDAFILKTLNRFRPNEGLVELASADFAPALAKEFSFYRWGSSSLVAVGFRPYSFYDLLAFQKSLLQNRPEREVIFVIPYLLKETEERLIQEGPSFLLLNGDYHYHEHLLRRGFYEEAPRPYSLSSQAVAEFFFFAVVRSYGLKEIAQEVPLSPMALSRACRTLQSLGFLAQEGRGTRKRFRLRISKKEYLRQLLPLLKNPLKERMFLVEGSLPSGLKGPEESLGHYTEISPLYEGVSVSVAAYPSLAADCLPEGMLKLTQPRKEVGVFSLGPYLPHDGYLNPLDVIAIYRSDNDERLKGELEKLIERLANGETGEV